MKLKESLVIKADGIQPQSIDNECLQNSADVGCRELCGDWEKGGEVSREGFISNRMSAMEEQESGYNTSGSTVRGAKDGIGRVKRNV